MWTSGGCDTPPEHSFTTIKQFSSYQNDLQFYSSWKSTEQQSVDGNRTKACLFRLFFSFFCLQHSLQWTILAFMLSQNHVRWQLTITAGHIHGNLLFCGVQTTAGTECFPKHVMLIRLFLLVVVLSDSHCTISAGSFFSFSDNTV